MTAREVIGRPFPKGHRNTHDCRTAGRKAAAASPWRHGALSTPNAQRLREKWAREGTLRQ